MPIVGWYYLHQNGSLIYKPESDWTIADIRESNFARGLWPVDPTDRATAWRICVEGLAAGANAQRVSDLASQWECTDADAFNYAEYIGARLFRDGDAWCATRSDFVNLHEGQAGFGDTCLGALSDLCRNLGYRPSKMWGAKFSDLLNGSRSTAEAAQ